MAEDAEEYLHRSREIEEIKELKESIQLLDDKISGAQRALVELKALNITQTMLNNLWVEVVGAYLSEEIIDNEKIKMRNEVLNELRVALASLRGKLTEEAIPEDAYKDWVKDARKRLSGIAGAEGADSLILSYSDWGKIIGLPGIEVEE